MKTEASLAALVERLTRELNRTRQNGNLLSVAQVAAALDRARKEPTG
jgi:hypothetical protein